MSTFLEIIRYDAGMDSSLTFGEWLMDMLNERGLNQRQFAEKLGVAEQTVSQWVTNTNNPTRRSCMLIARGLGLPLADVEERAGRRRPRAIDPVEEFHSLSENAHVYDSLSDLRAVQEQLQRAMDLLQVVLDQRGVTITRPDRDSKEGTQE